MSHFFDKAKLLIVNCLRKVIHRKPLLLAGLGKHPGYSTIAGRPPHLCRGYTGAAREDHITPQYAGSASITQHNSIDAPPSENGAISELCPVARATHIRVSWAHVEYATCIRAEDRFVFREMRCGHRRTECPRSRLNMATPRLSRAWRVVNSHSSAICLPGGE